MVTLRNFYRTKYSVGSKDKIRFAIDFDLPARVVNFRDHQTSRAMRVILQTVGRIFQDLYSRQREADFLLTIYLIVVQPGLGR